MLIDDILGYSQRSYILFLGLVAICIFLKFRYQRRRVRLDVPILRISPLPGKQGEQEDLKAFERNSPEVIQCGYEQYSKKGKNFILRTPHGLCFMVAPRFIEDIRKAPVSHLSAMASNNDVLQVKYTLHPVLDYDWYEFSVIHAKLTRNLATNLPEVADQVQSCWNHLLGAPSGAAWTAVHMWPVCLRIVTQTTNRSLFGKEIANSDEFTELSSSLSYVVFGGARIIDQYPGWLRPFILRWRTDVTRCRSTAKRLLCPLLNERIQHMQRINGPGSMGRSKEEENPNDVVQWVLERTPKQQLDDIDLLIARMFHLVVSAVHTSSQTFLDLLYDLALRPDVMEELQQEIYMELTREGGWSMSAFNRMTKLDSFIKESARFRPFVSCSVERTALQDFTLSDGSVIPKGVHVAVPHLALMFDKDIYGPGADRFDAFRFSKLQSETDQKQDFVHCSPNFLHFGYGRSACPGRFFASMEMKLLLCYVLSVYDIRYPAGQPKPQPSWYGWFRTADQSVKLEWRMKESPMFWQPKL